MNRVTTKRLGDIVNLKRGYDLPSYNRIEGAYPIISSSGISGYHSEYKVEGEGLVTGRYGTLGQMYYINERYWPHNTALYVTDFKGNYPKYVYFLMKCLGNLKTSDKSTVPGVNRNDLHEIIVPYIQPEFQKPLADCLFLIDSKIELNNRINSELEAMAKTLYDYWFVQFEFPDKDGKPYKTSGGKMVWNEELKRDIPEVWEDGILGDILSLEYGKPLKNEDRSGNGYPVLGSNGVVGYHNEYLVEGPGIVVGRKGTAGAVVWVEDNFYPIDTSFYVKDKLNVNSLFLHYFLLLRSNFKDVESGSAVPGLNRNFVYSVKIDIPEKFVIQHFNKIVEPYFSKIRVCNKENQTLSELRDWLLPMLMNGQVKVN